MDYKHEPVLLKEVIETLNVQKGKRYIDATLGGGGYSFEILKKGGIVLGIDLDQDAIDYVKEKFQISNFKFQIGKELTLVQGNFRDIAKIAHLNNFKDVSGIVFDLGLSSYQINQSGRGFSFLKEEPLDMRMNSSADSEQVKAYEIINTWNEEELYELFSKMGEERFSRTISNNIVRARRISPIKTSLELARIVDESIPEKRKIHPATKVFQAIRIAVNDEINNLKEGLKESLELLEKDGIIVAVSFHSLEDRIVKIYFREFEKEQKAKIIVKKPILPSEDEVLKNPRARSAKLRAIKKI